MNDRSPDRARRKCRIRGAATAAVLVVLTSPAAIAQPYYPAPPPALRGGDPYPCDLYARDQADRYVSRGVGVGAAAVRGAVGGAVFGGIVGGGKGARRGAVVAGGLSAVAAGARASNEREAARRVAYDDCMRGFPR